MIKERTKFKNVFIQPNAGDAGGSIGSAAYHFNILTQKKLEIQSNCYLGSSYSNNYIENKLIQKKLDNKNSLSIN